MVKRWDIVDLAERRSFFGVLPGGGLALSSQSAVVARDLREEILRAAGGAVLFRCNIMCMFT